MAIFKGNNKTKVSLLGVNDTGVSIITRGTVIKGKITAQSEIHIEGNFEGQIQSESVIVINNGGTGKGNIKANKMIINGLFEGESKCDCIEIHSQGKYRGDIFTDDLLIERGGSFIGSSHTKNDIKNN